MGGWSAAQIQEVLKKIWASFFMLLISFYKVVTQSKNNIPFLQRQHTPDTHIFRSLCKQLPTFVQGRKIVPCATVGKKDKDG